MIDYPFCSQCRVVTGVWLLLLGNVVQWKIHERPLVSYGGISMLDSEFVESEGQSSPESYGTVDGVDYFTLTYENRSINLDDVVLPDGKLVTGVRFAHRNGHVLLEVRGTDFDYAKGRLINLENSTWYSNENGGKHEIQIPNRLLPFENYNLGKLYVPQKFAKDSYVRFTTSDFKADLGRLPVPFLEKDLGIESWCPVALTGIGLTYMNDEELSTGGVIAPKLIVYKLPVNDLRWE